MLNQCYNQSVIYVLAIVGRLAAVERGCSQRFHYIIIHPMFVFHIFIVNRLFFYLLMSQFPFSSLLTLLFCLSFAFLFGEDLYTSYL